MNDMRSAGPERVGEAFALILSIRLSSMFAVPVAVNTIHPAPEIHEHIYDTTGYGILCTTSSTLSPTLRPL